MSKSLKEILGKLLLGPVIPGTEPERKNEARYVSFDPLESPKDLFSSVAWHVKPSINISTGVNLPNVVLRTPDGINLFALSFFTHVLDWQRRIEEGAADFGRLLAKINSNQLIFSDGRSFPISECKITFVENFNKVRNNNKIIGNNKEDL